MEKGGQQTERDAIMQLDSERERSEKYCTDGSELANVCMYVLVDSGAIFQVESLHGNEQSVLSSLRVVARLRKCITASAWG